MFRFPAWFDATELLTWGGTKELRSAEAATELLLLATNYRAWTEESETSGIPHSSVPPGRIGHAMLYRAPAESVLLIGGKGGNWWRHDLWSFDPAAGSWEAYPTTGSDDAKNLEAVANPLSNWVMGIATDTWTSFLTPPWIWSSETLAWEELPAATPEEYWSCLNRQGVLPDPESGGFLLVLCDGTYRYDPTNKTLTVVPALLQLTDEFSRRAWADELFATAPAGDVLIDAGAGRVQSIEFPYGRTTTLATNGPADVSAMVHDPANELMILIGDGALWSFDLDSRALERLGDAASAETGTRMYWRTAAAAYDEAADLVVIFDGEQTWTYDVESGDLRFISG